LADANQQLGIFFTETATMTSSQNHSPELKAEAAHSKKHRPARRLLTACRKGAVVVCGVVLLMTAWRPPLVQTTHAADQQALLKQLSAKTQLEHMTASDGKGRHVRLTYYAPVEAAIFWRFKTDFQNDWLVSNDYIEAHRFIAHRGNVVVTETKYTYGPDVFFRWRTELIPDKRILRYTLLNPVECEQIYNHGEITLEPDGAYTRVTHTSHFDFAGAFLWAHFPGPWGMVDFFRYTAQWEQETILRLKNRYEN
jgi:hypothetical protein